MSHVISAWHQEASLSALSRSGEHCKWGRWAEVIAKDVPATEGLNVTTGLLSHADVKRARTSSSSSSPSSSCTDDVYMDPELWGHLQDHINLEEMVIAKLPLHAFYRSLSVCKKWCHLLPSSQFLERCSAVSSSSLPNPYFILYGGQQICHQAMLVQDTEKWVLKALPSASSRLPVLNPDFPFHVAHGLMYTANVRMGTVLNLHTKILHCLPSLRIRSSGCAFVKLAVEKLVGSYKVLTVWCHNGTHCSSVYDSVTGKWTQKGALCPNLIGSELDSTYCEGVMYMKCGNASRYFRPPRRCHTLAIVEPKMLAYNFEQDSWTVLPLPQDHGPHDPSCWNIRRPVAAMHPYGLAPRPAPRRSTGPLMQGLGEWRGVLRDLTLTEEGGLRVWEFQLVTQTWVEVDRMPKPMLEWFLIEPHSLRAFLRSRLVDKMKTCYCEQYLLISRHDFAETSGLARFVLYDMERKSWETLNVAKNWICNCMPKKKVADGTDSAVDDLRVSFTSNPVLHVMFRL